MSASNFSSFLATTIRKMSTNEINRFSTMRQAEVNPSGWRQLGMYMTGSIGGPQTDDATIGQGGTSVAP